MSHRLFIALSALILLIAAGLRLYELSSYPPGPHYDEAVYLMMTRSIAFGGARFFPIVEAYQGREVLWMYLNAPLLSLFGDRILTLQYASAFLNLITIAASMGLARAIFRGTRGQIIALAVGAAFALSFPQVWLGRQAFRAVTLPFCQAVALWMLWHGLRARKRAWLWLTLAGFAAGCAIYTYMASRLFPLWLFVAGVGYVVFSYRTPRPPLYVERGRSFRKIILFLAVMAITIAPMVVYAIEKPDIFFGRLEEVTQAENSVTLVESIVLHLRMFFIEGDPYLRYNIPHRPYFTLPEGLILLLGAGVCLYRLIRGRGDAAERTAYLLALLSPLMVIPSVISVGGLPPSHMRSLGMIPMIFVLFGVGVEWIVSRASTRGRPYSDIQRFSRGDPMWSPAQKRYLVSFLLPIMLIGGFSVGTIYFDWAKRADVYYETDADLSAAAQWLANGADGDLSNTVIYMAARDKGHPTVMIEPTPPIRWIGTDTLFRAPPDMDGLYIFPRSAPPVEDWRAWLEAGRITDLPLAPDGRTAFEAFRLSGETALPDLALPSQAQGIRNPYLSYLGMEAITIPSGEGGWITSYWQIDAPSPFGDLTPLVEAYNEFERITRSENYMTETDRWLAGEILMLRTAIDVPPDPLAIPAAVRFAWIERTSDTYIPYESGGIWSNVGDFEISYRAWFPDLSTLDIDSGCEACVFDGLRLLGWRHFPTRRPGEMLRFEMYWQAEQDVPPIPTMTTALVTLSTEQLANMVRGEVRRTVSESRLPVDLANGDHPVQVQIDGQIIDLGVVRIEGMPRIYTAPTITHESHVVFGGAVALYGYTVENTADGMQVTFVWRSEAPVDRDYSVFVHRLNAAGEIIDQQDRQPANGETPTSLWLPGEYIIDNYTFPLDEQVVALRVGLYMPDDGQRLQMDIGEDSLIIPLE